MPQHCFTQSALLPSAVRRIAERSRSNTAFQLPRFTFSTGPFDRLRDPFRAQGSWAAAALLYAVCRVAERSRSTLHFNYLDLHFLPDPSIPPVLHSGILQRKGVYMLFSIALILSSGMCAAALLYAVRRVAERSRSTLLCNYLDLHFLADPSTGSGILFGLRDPFRA